MLVSASVLPATYRSRHETSASASRPVGLHLLAVFVPVARPHHEVLDAQAHQAPVQHETKRSGLVTTMHHVGLLHLLGDPRDERLRREALRRLRRGAVDLAHHDVLAPMHVDAKLDQAVEFDAWRGGGGWRRGYRGRGCGRWGALGIICDHGGRQVAPRRSPDHPMSTSAWPRWVPQRHHMEPFFTCTGGPPPVAYLCVTHLAGSNQA